MHSYLQRMSDCNFSRNGKQQVCRFRADILPWVNFAFIDEGNLTRLRPLLYLFDLFPPEFYDYLMYSEYNTENL